MEGLIELITDCTTCDLYERQVEEILRFCQIKDAIGISELDHFQELLVLLSDKIEAGDDRFSMPLIKLLKLGEKQFVSETSNSKYRHADSICNVLVTISSMLSSSDNLVKIASANVLYEFTKTADPAKEQSDNHHDQRPSTWTYNQHLFHKSGAMANVAQAIRNEVDHLFGNDVDGDGRISASEYDKAYGILPGDANDKPEVCTVSLMKLVRELSNYRDNALSLNRENVATLLVKVVSLLNDFRKEEIKLMIQILWSVLDHSIDRINVSKVASNRMQLLDKYRHANALYSLGNPSTLEMLRAMMERMLHEGFKDSDKELRNEVLIISSLLSRRKDNLAFFQETGFTSLLLLYSTASENELPTGSADRNFASNHPLDLEMKLLMWYLIKILSKEPQNFNLVAESLFLPSLLLYIDPAKKNHPARAKWSEQQLQTLQLNALTMLGYMVPLLSEQFLEIEGPSKLIAFLQGNVLQDADAYDQQKRDILVASLELFLQMTSIPGYSQHIIPNAETCMMVMQLLVNYLHLPNAEVRCLSVLSIAKLCTGEKKVVQKCFRKCGGVTSITQVFLVPERVTTDFLYTDSVLIAALSCVHNAIIGCLKSELRFLSDDGVERLLDVLELTQPLALQGQILAVLADLVKYNKHAIPYVLNWKSERTGRSAVVMILDIWLTFFSASCIEDFERPLLRTSESRFTLKQVDHGVDGKSGKRRGKLAERLETALKAAKNIMIPEEERRVLDGAKSIDVRDRIFAVLSSLGFEHICEESLSRDQRIIFALCKGYVDFVKGEEWITLRENIKEHVGVKPIYYDQQFLDTNINQSMEKAKQVQQVQMEEIWEKEKDIEKLEQQFYDKIIEKRDQAIQANLVKKQVTVMKRRMEQKEKQRQMIERANINQQHI